MKKIQGRLGGSVGWASNFSSGHDLAVCEFEPCVGLCADGSEPGACFGFCVSLSLSAYPPAHTLGLSLSLKNKINRGAWVAQSVGRPTWAQVMISRLMSLSPSLASVLTAQSLEPASDSVSPSLSLLPPPLSLSLKNK